MKSGTGARYFRRVREGLGRWSLSALASGKWGGFVIVQLGVFGLLHSFSVLDSSDSGPKPLRGICGK